MPTRIVNILNVYFFGFLWLVFFFFPPYIFQRLLLWRSARLYVPNPGYIASGNRPSYNNNRNNSNNNNNNGFPFSNGKRTFGNKVDNTRQSDIANATSFRAAVVHNNIMTSFAPCRSIRRTAAEAQARATGRVRKRFVQKPRLCVMW